MSIRENQVVVKSGVIVNEVSAIRGDTICVQIRKEIPEGALVRSQLRKTPDSETYYILTVDGQNVVIPPEISSLLEGNYIFDVEMTVGDVVTTLQRTSISFIADVTRVFGEQDLNYTSDFERNNIVARHFFIRESDNSLTEIPLEGLNQLLIDTTTQVEIASNAATDALNAKNDVVELKSELIATYHRQFIQDTPPSDPVDGDIWIQTI